MENKSNSKIGSQIEAIILELAKGIGEEATKKIQGYAERIKAGEEKDKVLQGLPKSFTDGVEKLLEVKKEGEFTNENKKESITIDEVIFVNPTKYSIPEENGSFNINKSNPDNPFYIVDENGNVGLMTNVSISIQRAINRIDSYLKPIWNIENIDIEQATGCKIKKLAKVDTNGILIKKGEMEFTASGKIEYTLETTEEKRETKLSDNENKKSKEELFEKIRKYKEKEKLYNEEKTRLNNLLHTLEEELKLSQKKDEEDYLASLEKTKSKKTKKSDSEEVLEILNEIKGNEKKPKYIDILEKKENIAIEKQNSNEESLSEFNKVVEQIPKKDKDIIEKEMKKGDLLPFESPKVKTNYRDFIKNNIVKLVSGLKISPKIKNIIEKSGKKTLMTMAVLTLWTNAGSFENPSNTKLDISLLNNKEISNTTKKDTSIGDLDTYNKLPKNGKEVYLYAMSKLKNECYIIVDKPSATMHIISGDGKMITSIPVILGQMKGESPNMANPDSDIAEYATTPAGKFNLMRKGLAVVDSDIDDYEGKIIAIQGTDLAIHITYPKELKKRTKALLTETPSDNRMSWGCINIDKKMWDEYITPNFNGRETIFILPDYPELASLNPETGQIEDLNINKDGKLLAMN